MSAQDHHPQYGYQQQHYQPSYPAAPDLQVQGGWGGGGAGPGTGGYGGEQQMGMQLPMGGSYQLPLAEPEPEQVQKQVAGVTELVKVTAKSCANCRTRKVKCDRRYPECSRCLKRKEGCDYGDDVSIALRPTWVIPGEHDDLVSNPSLQHPSYVAPRSAFASSSSHPYLPRPSNPPTFDSPRSLRTISNGEIQQALTVAGKTGNVAEETQEEEGFTKLWEGFLSASNLGASSSDWRLAVPTMAASLQVHLIEASMHSCCAYLPAFHAFASEVDNFKHELSGAGNLDLASQVIVSILASLGARASPHSALLGVAGPDIENGKASLDLVKSAGQRRENAWRAIVNRATELASRPEILQVPTARNAQTLVAFVQMLMLAEAKPRTARFFLRTAMGVFRDMQHSDLPPAEIQKIKSAVGPTLFESDSRIAAYLSMPVVITEEDLYEYFDGTGVQVPDLATEDLGPLLNDVLDPAQGLVTRERLDRALAVTGYFVCQVQRFFSSITSGRRYSNRFLTGIPQMYTYIDRSHAAVQKLHRRLVSLDYVPDGCDTTHSVDYDLLIAVRMDERLLDVVHLAYEWLKKQRNEQGLSVEDRSALDELLATSERRVRKCLKLLAFYSKVFTDSSDKHCVYHLFTQLEALPDWAVMAAQREGEMTDYEPLPAECALTDVELDWFTKALELACFFTPLAHDRLNQLTHARAIRQRAPAVVDQWSYDLSVPASAPTPGQLGLHQHSHSHSHPHSHHDSASHSRATSPPGSRQAASRAWNFDSYGTPTGFVENVSPPAQYAQTPAPTSIGSDGSLAHLPQPPPPSHLQQQQQQRPPYITTSSYELPNDGLLPPPPPPAPHSMPSFSRHSSYGDPTPSPTNLSSFHQQQQQHLQQQPQQLAQQQLPQQQSALSPSPASPFGGYDYDYMLAAEASRTGSTPRGALVGLPGGGGGASITEMPDEVVGANGAGGGGMQHLPPPVPQQGGLGGGGGGGGPAGWSNYTNGGW